MKFLGCLRSVFHGWPAICKYPSAARQVLSNLNEAGRGMKLADEWIASDVGELRQKDTDNPLWDYFSKNESGPGILKWSHYFEIYHRYFAKFRGRAVNVMEVGVYSGGSLPMWKWYFGNQCHVYGVDIEPACRRYERDGISVLIGDQKDREFWKSVREKIPPIDIFIDDGGHEPEQQMVTMEEMLPALAPGGVFVTEDVHGVWQPFSAFATAMVTRLNAANWAPEKNTHVKTGFQQAIHSIHAYPFMCVVEKHAIATHHLSLMERGTEWQPFLDR